MCAKFAHQHRGDGLGKGLEQLHRVLREKTQQPLTHHGVVDGVADAVGIAGAAAWQAGAQVHADGLRGVQLAFVDADHRFGGETLDEDQVQRRERAGLREGGQGLRNDGGQGALLEWAGRRPATHREAFLQIADHAVLRTAQCHGIEHSRCVGARASPG